jgi:hypothetical protein
MKAPHRSRGFAIRAQKSEKQMRWHGLQTRASDPLTGFKTLLGVIRSLKTLKSLKSLKTLKSLLPLDEGDPPLARICNPCAEKRETDTVARVANPRKRSGSINIACADLQSVRAIFLITTFSDFHDNVPPVRRSVSLRRS